VTDPPTQQLPLFPLSTVLFPGLLLPLHVFEERYRRLVSDHLVPADPQERRFGVVAIGEGTETGTDGVRSLHEVGCVARVRELEHHDDGTSDLVTVGAERFRVHEVDESGPYLTAAVEMLDEPDGDEAAVLASATGSLFARYRTTLLSAQGRSSPTAPELPDDPVTLSYLVAAATVLFVGEKQQLLEAPDAASRLRLELEVLRQEVAVLRHLPSLPAVELLQQEVAAS